MVCDHLSLDNQAISCCRRQAAEIQKHHCGADMILFHEYRRLFRCKQRARRWATSSLRQRVRRDFDQTFCISFTQRTGSVTSVFRPPRTTQFDAGRPMDVVGPSFSKPPRTPSRGQGLTHWRHARSPRGDWMEHHVASIPNSTPTFPHTEQRIIANNVRCRH